MKLFYPNKRFLLFLPIFILAVYLYFSRVYLMPFYGDIGWFYISARDMLLTGHIPLVGITSSHTWLHQGPYWTYALAFALLISHFNPLSGGYLIAAISLLTLVALYVVTKRLFSEKTAVVAVFLYTVSPLVVYTARTPFDPSPIPLFVILYVYSLYKLTKGFMYHFALLVLYLCVLYNLELATVVFVFPLIVIVVYGIWKKEKWIKKILSYKILLSSIGIFLLAMLPIILYDTTHGYVQTLKYAGWLVFHTIRFILPIKHIDSGNATVFQTAEYFLKNIQALLYLPNSMISSLLFFVSIMFGIVDTYLLQKAKKYWSPQVLLHFIFLVLLASFIGNKTPSDAYMPMFFPFVILLTSLLISKLLEFRVITIPVILCMLLFGFINIDSFVKNDYSLSKAGVLNYSQELTATQIIVSQASGKQYNIKGVGPGSQFRSFTMPYEYLAWYLGHPESAKNQDLVFYVKQTQNSVSIFKR